MRARASLLLLLAASLPAAAVDGTVVNLTTGKPAAGSMVTLYRMDQDGMSPVETTRTDSEGKFSTRQDAEGAKLLQVIFDGVVYSHMLTPGMPSTGMRIEVYNASRQPGAAHVEQHMVLLEPAGGQLNVTEALIFRNGGKTTYNDPDNGTLRFWLPREAKGIVQVNATAPGGMPVQRQAAATSDPNIYKLEFPIKPGETRIELRYLLPIPADSRYEGKILHKGVTRLVTPAGVTLAGDNIRPIGEEPQTHANIYEVKGAVFNVALQGSGTLQQQQETEEAGAGPEIERIMPKVWESARLITVLAFGILALGFALLYRAKPKA